MIHVCRCVRARANTGAKNAYYINCGGWRYTPVNGDYVIGTVTGKTSEAFKVCMTVYECVN
jgi:exosome complex RNA-binding protein Rrp4